MKRKKADRVVKVGRAANARDALIGIALHRLDAIGRFGLSRNARAYAPRERVSALTIKALYTVEQCLRYGRSGADAINVARLLAQDDAAFWHDMTGMAQHYDFVTGKMVGCFVPLCGYGKGLD